MKIGVDIGGTSVKLGVVDDDFSIVEMTKIPTGEKCTPDGVTEKIIEQCLIYKEKYDISSVGVGCAGRIDRERGMVIVSGHLPFRNYKLVEPIQKALNLPTYIDNDASCAMIGEYAAGSCKGASDAIIVTIGTGIGGAILIDKKIYRGHNNRAGELGHMVIDMGGDECECSLHGCFEQYASATALLKLTENYANNYPESILAQLVEKEGCRGFVAFDAAKDGCEVAKALLDEYAQKLCVGLNSIIHIFQPEVLVLSGGIAKEGDTLLELIEPYVLKDCPIRITAFDGNGGLLGAALLGTEYDN